MTASDTGFRTAMSACAIYPLESVLPSLCSGITCVDYDRFITEHEQNEYGLVALLEYATDDVIVSDSDILVISQCNIVFVELAETFNRMVLDGTVEATKITHRQKLAATSFYPYKNPVMRCRTKASEFLVSMARNDRLLALNAMCFVKEIYKRIGGILELYYWLIMIVCSKSLQMPSEKAIYAMVNVLRKKSFPEFDIYQLLELSSMLCEWYDLRPISFGSECVFDAIRLARIESGQNDDVKTNYGKEILIEIKG